MIYNKKFNFKKDLLALVFQAFCFTANFLAILFLVSMLFIVFTQGTDKLSLDFLLNYPSRFASRSGIFSSLIGSCFMMLLITLFVVPMGVGTAIYLEEYAPKTKVIQFMKLNIQNLSGVPSIIYGMLGLTFFVQGLSLGRSLLAGALIMTLLVLPIVVITTQEALKGIPNTLRWAGFGIGMTKSQVVLKLILPQALPNITTGSILALSRAIGETAPLIVIGALTYVPFIPSSLLDQFTVLPIQIFNWAARPQKEFHDIAAAGIIVLLSILLTMNSFAIYLRIKYQKKYKT